ncbi:MAG: DUF6194 family protein [Actinomycetales bacterium]|jgi:hypothetical protein|nr:DUF6194 family protein [Leifsonia sp.]
MDMKSIIETVQDFDGALVVQPEPGSAFPEISWGDAYFYYAPDGTMPERTQPYGTIITKNYPDDAGSQLDIPGRFRANVHAGRDAVAKLPADIDPASVDTFMPHPIYASAGWVSVINPSATSDRLIALLRQAHDAARARAERRSTV